jgi:small subunit ribosomal protein S8e
MVIIQSKSRRKASGARYKSKIIKKRQSLIGRIPAMTKIEPLKEQMIRIRSGNFKHRLLSTNKVNLYNSETKKHSVVDIITVVDCPANKNYIRRNIMIKGTIIKTSMGNARVTSRPGQSGSVNAILIKE